MKIGIYGDPHGGYDGSEGGEPSEVIHQEIVSAIRGCDYWINLGDSANHNSQEGWLEFESTVWPILKPGKYFPVRGNHDGIDNDWLNFYHGFHQGSTYYATELSEDVLLVVLDICISGQTFPCDTPHYQPMADWLMGELLMSKHLFKIVCYHSPPYTMGLRGPNLCARTMFHPILKRFDVDLLLCGHTHAYERFWDGMNIVNLGGGGGVPHELAEPPPPPTSTDESDVPIGIECYNYGILRIENGHLNLEARNTLTHEIIDEIGFYKEQRPGKKPPGEIDRV
jgi:predicted phosphodiesterase